MLGIGAQCPTGKLRMSAMRNLPVVLICRMATALPNTPNQLHVSACPVPTRGAYRDRHGRWVRDAMDASDAVDESAALRTAKLCGPDAPMLASSLRVNNPQATVAKEPGHRGERRISRRTIAQGRPDCFGEPVVTTLVRFFVACEAAGASCIRLSLRPLCFRGTMFVNNSGAIRAAGSLTHVPSLSCPGLTRASRDRPVKPGDDLTG